MKKSVFTIAAIAIAVLTMSSCSKDDDQNVFGNNSTKKSVSSTSNKGSDGSYTQADVDAAAIVSLITIIGSTVPAEYYIEYTATQGSLSASDYNTLSNSLKGMKDNLETAPIAVKLEMKDYTDKHNDTITSMLSNLKSSGATGVKVTATLYTKTGTAVACRYWQ